MAKNTRTETGMLHQTYKKPAIRAVPVKQEKIKSPDFRGEYGVTSVTPFLFASISLAE